MKNLSVLILAAGEGTRMKSVLPKVLHAAAGKPLLEHVLSAAAPLKAATGIVVGRGADEVKAALRGRDLRFFTQKERRGSGHAVKCASRWLAARGGDVVVLCGDAPLITPDTVRRLAGLHRREGNQATLLTARVPDPAGYGRVARDAAGRPRAIVEHKDAPAELLAVNEINSGAYCFAARPLLWALGRLKPDNAKGEYYLTDAVGLLAGRGGRLGALTLADGTEILGVNRRAELAEAGRLLRGRALEALMDQGVSVLDPASTHVDAGVRVEADAVLFPHTFLRGNTRVGRGARVGPFSFVEDSVIDAGAEVRASFVYGSRVGPGAKVGPYAHIRPGTVLGRGARAGNFVEVKKSRIGAGAKISHLAYVGDATLGDDVNVGAGAITCNYDGIKKNRTVVGRGAFIGSNANLVAPLFIGAGALVGAGSTITRDVPAGALALERSTQLVKPGWVAKNRKSK